MQPRQWRTSGEISAPQLREGITQARCLPRDDPIDRRPFSDHEEIALERIDRQFARRRAAHVPDGLLDGDQSELRAQFGVYQTEETDATIPTATAAVSA